MLPWWYYDNGSSIMIMGAYCVGKVHNMLPWWYYDNGSILYRLCTQYATSVVL